MRGGGVMGWTPTPEQREALIRARDLTRMLRDGGVSWKLIADRLTADGYPTMRGGPWTYQMVQRLLRNPPPAGPSKNYATCHWRVDDRRGAAKLLKCVHCANRGIDKQAHDWACLHGRDGVDPQDFIPLCRKCHMAYDPDSGHRVPHTEEAKAKMSKAVRRGLADGTRIGRYYPRRRPAEGQAAQHEEKRKQAGEPGEAA